MQNHYKVDLSKVKSCIEYVIANGKKIQDTTLTNNTTGETCKLDGFMFKYNTLPFFVDKAFRSMIAENNLESTSYIKGFFCEKNIVVAFRKAPNVSEKWGRIEVYVYENEKPLSKIK